MDQVITGAVLLGFLIAATVTDIRENKIYNWTTYPGMVAGLLLNGWFGGWAGVEQSALGGGDVKLIAMMGAFLGLENGIEAMLWTFILGSLLGIAMLIARFGVAHLVRKSWEHLRLVWRAKGWIPPTEAEREPLKRWLFLAPAALCAAGIVLGKPWLRAWGILY
jgi:prepilin peptidase CpaA